jgi:methylaspartate ammonia-lyase
MKIERAIAVPVLGGYFNDDLAAIRAGARRDGFFYEGRPVTPGFTRINQPSEAVSIVLLLTNGQAVAGDAMSVASFAPSAPVRLTRIIIWDFAPA